MLLSSSKIFPIPIAISCLQHAKVKNLPLATFNSNYFTPGTIKCTIDTLSKYRCNMTPKIAILHQKSVQYYGKISWW